MSNAIFVEETPAEVKNSKVISLRQVISSRLITCWIGTSSADDEHSQWVETSNHVGRIGRILWDGIHFHPCVGAKCGDF